jgi:hypothetical protein
LTLNLSNRSMDQLLLDDSSLACLYVHFETYELALGNRKGEGKGLFEIEGKGKGSKPCRNARVSVVFSLSPRHMGIKLPF